MWQDVVRMEVGVVAVMVGMVVDVHRLLQLGCMCVCVCVRVRVRVRVCAW